jgi:hypothetical protein
MMVYGYFCFRLNVAKSRSAVGNATARYARLAASPLHEAADTIGARIVAALDDARNPEPPNVGDKVSRRRDLDHHGFWQLPYQVIHESTNRG